MRRKFATGEFTIEELAALNGVSYNTARTILLKQKGAAPSDNDAAVASPTEASTTNDGTRARAEFAKEKEGAGDTATPPATEDAEASTPNDGTRKTA